MIFILIWEGMEEGFDGTFYLETFLQLCKCRLRYSSEASNIYRKGASV